MADDPLIPSNPVARNNFLGGVLLAALGVAMIYFFAWRPLQALQTTGQMEYSAKGVVLGPLCLYVAALAFTGRFRDGEIRKRNDKGQPSFTRKGWIVMAGALLVMALTYAVWAWYLRSLGATPAG